MFETIAANCNIALIYKQLGDNAKSVEFYKSALETASEMDETEDSPFFEQITKIRAALHDQLELADSENKTKDLGTSQLSSHSFGDRLERSDLNRRYIDAQQDYFDSEARISREQGDLSTAYGALVANGKLNCVYGDFERAEQYYRQALDVAKLIGSSELVNHAKVAIGIVKGSQALKSFGGFDESAQMDLKIFDGPSSSRDSEPRPPHTATAARQRLITKISKILVASSESRTLSTIRGNFLSGQDTKKWQMMRRWRPTASVINRLIGRLTDDYNVYIRDNQYEIR
jgi:tetratricopeptide (TPR) repeat protein